MKKIAMRLLSMLIVLSMVLSAAPLTALAANNETSAPAAANNSFDLSAIQNVTLLNVDDVEVDEDDPAIIALGDELKNIQVLNAEGDTVPLTETEIATIKQMYQAYMDHWAQNANVLGVQTPFFLSYNDDGEDGLGVLGEMLILAGNTVDQVRNGELTYQQITGTIETFLYADQFGVQLYGNAIKNARDEVLDLIEESGALNDAQKYLVINNWLAQNVTFDMEYIMNSGKADEEKPMFAENPQKHQYYQTVYDAIYDQYIDTLTKTFKQQIVDGLKAEMQKQFYVAAIKQGVYDQAYAQAETQIKDSIYQQAYDAVYQDAYDQAYAEYIEENTHVHSYTSAVTTEPTCVAAGVMTYTCECGDSYTEEIAATGEHADSEADEDELCDVCGADMHVHSYSEAVTTAATCTVDGVKTFTCTCGDSYTEAIPATGHTYAEEVTTAATCGADGLKTLTCVCGDTKTEVIPATGEHVDVAAKDGVCDVCLQDMPIEGEEDKEPVNAEGDETEDEGEETEPTLEEQADAYAKEKAEAAATAAGNAAVEENAETIETQAASAADSAVNDFMTDNEPAINEDPVAFVETAFGADAAAQIASQWDATWADWEANGIPGMVDMFAAEIWPAVIEQFYIQGMTQQGMTEEQAAEQAAAIMEADADAIAADPYGYCVENFGQEAADQAQGIVNDQLSQMGIDPSKETNPEGRVSLDVIVALQMDTPQEDPMLQKEDGSYMTPNEAIPVFATQAATQLTDAVLNYWKGSHFGALAEGSAVCLGYTKAFTYLVQCLKSDIYTTNGNINNASNWKTAADLYYNANGELDVTMDYAVDSVRISFAAEVTMFGETENNFNSDHFWNAVQIDGQWFYIDPCYVDVYTEVMMRDRVETDGSVNHMYFLFSHSTAAELYDGNYSDIKTLYGTGTGVGTDTQASASPADSTEYEDSWISRIKSNLYFNDGVAYYIYNSTDLITLMQDSNSNSSSSDVSMSDFEVKLVGHTLTNGDKPDVGDSDYTAYIEFNYFEDEEDEESVARVRDAEGNMIENAMLTELYADHQAATEIYPSLAITCALYNNKLYFNLDTSILYYDLETCEVVRVKEYNTVHGVRDDSNPFGGMAFTTTDSADSADFTVYNHPITGMSLKDDGNLYVSIATNFAFISGKDAVDDQTSYGYEFEESNYNADYNSYTASQYEDNDIYEQMGYEKEVNDNDEFMWSANFVETISMSKLAGTSHDYEEVSVEATCRHNAYTENRCADCGAIEDGTRVEVEGTAHAHHYIYFYETYYTNSDSGSKNTGHCYVCTECGFAIEEPTEPQENSMYEDYGTSYEEQMEIYEAELAIYNEAKETAGHTYVPTDATWAADNSTVTFSNLECSAICPERAGILDCLLVNDEYNTPITATLNPSVTADASIIDTIGTCPEGVIQVWGASGSVTQSGHTYNYTVTKEVALEKAECEFEGGFCPVCGDCTVHRVSGDSRYETSLASADALKATLGVESFDTIIVASGSNFADALTGSYLATVKSAPILLYSDKVMDTNVAYITENLTEGGTVYILGGVNSVSEAMETALTDLDITVKRLAGDDRYATNLAILEEAGVTDQELLVCTGGNFADSLSASATGLPMLLVNKTLTASQTAFLETLDGNAITIIGGVNSVNETIEAALGENVTRIAGETREETSILVAQKYFENPDFIVLAYSRNYPDGLCGGPLAYALKAPLVLTNAGAEAVATEYAAANEVTHGLILGGVNSISDATAKTVFGLTGEGVIPAL